MAAVNGALMSMLKAGDHVVAARALFGSCLYILEDILPRFGVEVTFVDGTDLSAWARRSGPAREGGVLRVHVEPDAGAVDIEAVAAGPWGGRDLVVVDNVFATPVFSDAIGLGPTW
jgi:O-succinylhomoserine sulfhydrylase